MARVVGQLAGIAQLVTLPDQSLLDAYRTGFIYTQIIRSGDELKTGANGYDQEFSHDVIGILANLFTQGYTSDANWAAPFLFGRWAWDGYLFGAPRTGPGLSLIDATYDYGFGRLRGKLPPDSSAATRPSTTAPPTTRGTGNGAWPAPPTGIRAFSATSS
jgi:hypothetical protein